MRRARKRRRPPAAGAAPLKRLVFPGALLLAGYWAVFGGEYSVFEVRQARQDRESEAAEAERLRRQIDSLQAWTDSLENDPATLERLARERYGMIRSGEILYRFAEPDSGLDGAGGDTIR
jgi:cell division protein FtsB